MEIFPGSEVYTLVFDSSRSSPALRARRVHTSLLQKFPRAKSWYPYYLPLFPLATERLDLGDAELVITSDAATMKGVRFPPGAIHICYCYTPMRYVWSGYETYASGLGPVARALFSIQAERLRQWDFQAAQKVTHFVAISKTVARRISRYYGRESSIIYPPVDTDYFVPDYRTNGSADYYVHVSQLVPYKRADLLVEAFNRSGRPLVVIGEGSEKRKLEFLARPNIRFLGAQPRAEIRRHLQACRGFVFAGEEDFGIAMVEALACGTPVLALGEGGATEIVKDGRTGILFEEQTVGSLLGGLSRFENQRFDPGEIRHSALRFNRPRFIEEFSRLVDEIQNQPNRQSPNLSTATQAEVVSTSP
jgi:glycosyltransferase involved in cell wall biosynthesis